MLDWWNDFSLNLFDFLLGWLLALPRQVGVVAIGLATAALVVIIRKWTTNQDRLRRAVADLQRLKELRRDARDAQDKDALSRLARTKGQIGILKVKAEGWPLLAILLPVTLLATWAFQRVAFQPPPSGEPIEVVALLPVSAENDVVHLVPQAGLKAVNGWVQAARVANDDKSTATWQLQADTAAEPYPLVIRWKADTLEHELLVGQRSYSTPRVQRGDEVEIAIDMRETRLLGIPGLGPWLPAWIVGYLLVTIPAVPLLKRLLKIY